MLTGGADAAGRTLSMNDTFLTTSRLTMTPFAEVDFVDCFAMRSNPAVTRFVGGVQSREDVWARALRYIVSG
jgi:hypothetical protein